MATAGTVTDPADLNLQVRDCCPPPDCVQWDPPSFLLCDPCIDLDNPDHELLWNQAWQSVTSWLYQFMGNQWPGTCFEEIIRPCVRPRCGCRGWNGCPACGVYEWLPLDGATCLPVLGVREVWVGPNPCNGGEAYCLTPGDGVRLEYVHNQARLVLENRGGCCGTWPTQDLCQPTGGEGTWHISLLTGAAPPKWLVDAAAAMTGELVKECVVSGCRLPGKATRLSFDGTTVDIDDERGATLPLRLLQQVLDRRDANPGVVEQFGSVTDTVWHRVAGPNPVPSSECPAGCDGRAGCGC